MWFSCSKAISGSPSPITVNVQTHKWLKNDTITSLCSFTTSFLNSFCFPHSIYTLLQAIWISFLGMRGRHAENVIIYVKTYIYIQNRVKETQARCTLNIASFLFLFCFRSSKFVHSSNNHLATPSGLANSYSCFISLGCGLHMSPSSRVYFPVYITFIACVF